MFQLQFLPLSRLSLEVTLFQRRVANEAVAAIKAVHGREFQVGTAADIHCESFFFLILNRLVQSKTNFSTVVDIDMSHVNDA